MTDDRRNIKVDAESFEHHNERRQELGLSWAEYIDGEAPDPFGRIEEAVERVPERTADELEERFR